MSVFLGIDIGTSGTKTLAMDALGAIRAEATETYPCHVPRPLWSEQDPEDWWRATVRSVRRVIRQAKLRPADVTAIGLSGQMHGSVFLDKRDCVVRPAILWNDQRTAAECDEIERRAGGRAALIRMAANPALTGFTAPKILWLRNHEPRHFDATRKVLLPKDEIRRRMTGEYATDVSDASGTLLLDVARRRWSRRLLAKLDLDPDLLPECFESEDITGTLTSAAAKELGLSTGCVVVGGAGDCAAGAVGNGIVRRGVLSTSIGTSGVVFVHSDQPKVDPQGRVHTFCHAVRGKWHMMGVNLSAGGSLQWFRNALCQAETDRAKREGRDVYDILTAEAADVPPGSQGLFFLPYLSGERTPHADPDARGCFVGLTLAHGRGHLVRAVMEGVTYAMRESIEIFDGLGVPIRQIRVSGGGSRSPVWRQIQADVFGRKVTTINAEQGPAYGAALLAAVGAGAFSNIEEACRATIHVVKRTSPRQSARRAYNQAFPVYSGLYKVLADEFKRITALPSAFPH
ncbi:MAG: xylulokinase [Pirellulales bacterium]|nr:xylulokinase [Pirellulales bacterium]